MAARHESPSLEFVGGWLAAVLVGIAGSDPLPVAPPPRDSGVGELVRQLGSDDYHEREAATKKLAALDVLEPPTELLLALESPSPEVRQRAQQAIRAVRLRAIGRTLKPGRAFAARGQVDLFVAATAAWKLDAEDDRLWQPALDLTGVIAKRAEFPWWPPADCPRGFGSMDGFRESIHPRFIRSDRPHQQERPHPVGQPVVLYPGGIMAPGVSSPRGFTNNIIVSRGEVRPVTCVSTSIVYANGNVMVGSHLANTILICDGDVTVEDHISNALVVVRGSIRAGSFATGSTLVAGSTVKLGRPNPLDKQVAGSVNVNAAPRPKGMFASRVDKRLANVVKENETNAFGYITFFELSTVGVEVKLADKALRVASVAADRPFASAGVRVGDIITAVNGKTPDSPESLRRLLRDALAIGDATVKLQRGDTVETVTMSLPE